jgi:hypothetical protein
MGGASFFRIDAQNRRILPMAASSSPAMLALRFASICTPCISAFGPCIDLNGSREVEFRLSSLTENRALSEEGAEAKAR